MKKRQYLGRTFVVAGMAIGLLVGSNGALAVQPKEPSNPYKGIRESTLGYLALGTPDDLLRLRDAFDRTEEEMSRVQLDVPPRPGPLQLKQARLKDLKGRLGESETLLRFLESSGREIADRERDRISLESRNDLRKALQVHIKRLGGEIQGLEKAIRFEAAEYLRVLADERRALGRLLVVRREQLLGEYAGLRECRDTDRSCLHRKLKTLCRLKPLIGGAERAPILQLIQEIDSRLGLSGQSASGMCEYLQHDVGL